MAEQSSKRRAIIIGAGFGGLGLAALLGKQGISVDVFEKHGAPGGRARMAEAEGFVFDMGPSWYMMPDVFEEFFALLGENIHDHLTLQKLAPSYRVFTPDGQHHDLFADRQRNAAFFDSLEPGSGARLTDYLDESARQYQIAKHEFIYKNYNSVFDFINKRVLKEGRKLEIWNSMERIIGRTFQHDLLRKVMMFQMVLLGTAPKDAPGMYRLMNHVDFDLGIWYPAGGIGEVPKAIANIATKHGVRFHYHAPVARILTDHGHAIGVELANGDRHQADMVISGTDLHHTETALLSPTERDHSDRYWARRTLAPSAFIMYLGVKKTLPTLSHHNLLFSDNWDLNFKELFNHHDFPTNPSLYVCAPSKTDPTVAPAGCENLFVLVPISAGLTYDDATLETWSARTLTLMENSMGLTGLKSTLVYKKCYSVKDFARDYHSYKGTALGLAHTLGQSALWRPNNVSKKVKNLYFVGAYVNPGIGMPICLISAQTAYKRIMGITDPSPLTTL
jgi:phytoene desaturase